MQRRHLLQATAALGLGALTSTTRLYAAPAETPRFLLVFLRGGYDSTSLLVPSGNAFYEASRPNIAIPAPQALPLTGEWALHPALKGSLLPLVERGEAAFIPFAGTDNLSRSHFETQDSIELGRASDAATRDFESGFMNRLAQAIGAVDAISFTDQLPLTFRGEAQVGNLSLRNVSRLGVEPRLRGLVASMYRDQALGPQVQAGFALRDQVAQEIAQEQEREKARQQAQAMVGEMAAANRNAVTAKGFELEARRIARLMRDRHALGFIDIGGWDTHVGQGAASGYLATRFDELGRGLAAYADEIGPAVWKRTVVMVVSEFGRTWRENGNRGTDHGHGSVYWVLGGSLACPKVVGEQMLPSATTLFQNRDLPVLNEYRSVLGGLFARQFGLSGNALQAIFPGATPGALSLV